MRAHLVVALSSTLVVACSSPAPHAWLEPGSTLPVAEDDATLSEQIAENDGVDAEVLRIHGFAEGGSIWYWSFGEVGGAETMPLYVPCRRTGARCLPVDDHPPIAESLPGEPGYSHYGRVYELELTDAWAGELVPSREAIDDAVRDGLMLAPVESDRYAHCPIVHGDTRIEVAPDTFVSPTPIHVRGMVAHCAPFYRTHGLRTLTEEGDVLVRNVYALSRDGESMPLNEIARGVDLTGDGDTRDTNNITGVGYANANYTPVWRLVRVVVPSTYSSIDTAMDDTMADYRAGTDMFTIDAVTYEITPIDGRVVSHEETTTHIDCPIQSERGAL